MGHLEDLDGFRQLLDDPLKAACSAFENCDEELAGALNLACKQARQLVDGAVFVVLRWGAMFRDVGDILEHDLRPGLAHCRHDSLAVPLGRVQSLAVEMRRMAKSIRRDYVRLLDSVGRLESCAELAAIALEAPGGPPGTAAGHSAAEGTPEAFLGLGRGHLRRAEGVLRECSDSWLLIHSVECALDRVQDEPLRLHSSALRGGDDAVFAEAEELCWLLLSLGGHFS